MMPSPNKLLLVIAGPTASGKTSLAIRLAKEFNTEILSCDSRQLYKEMTIGTAKPSDEELSSVPHHFIDSHSIVDDFDAGQYEQDANAMLSKLFLDKDIVVMAGGTGLFIKSAVEGLDKLPARDEAIRKRWSEVLEKQGIEPLQDRIKELDFEKWEGMDQHNPQRLIRAIEICELSGKTHAELQRNSKKERAYKTIFIALDVPREELYARIDNRVDEMMDAGLLDEVRSLKQYREYNALKTVGYSELFDALDGKMSLEEAVDKIKQHSRNYAKRQITWFKKMDMSWFAPTDYEAILDFVKSEIG